MRDGGADITLANAGGTGDQHVEVLADPGKVRDLGELVGVEAWSSQDLVDT